MITQNFDGFSEAKIRNYYLLNPLEDGERKFKLLLTQTDRQSLIAVVQQKTFPAEYSHRIRQNFDFFYKKIQNLKSDLALVCKGLSKLIIVDIALNRDQDNPQLIFESMNSTGQELGQADLIRNFVLMDLDPKEQTLLYEQYWRPIEINFGQQGYGDYFDSFMRHYLTVKTGDIPNVGQVYESFKDYSRQFLTSFDGIALLLQDIQTFSNYYCNMALDKETDKVLAEGFKDLRELKVDVAYPLLLELYDDFQKEILLREEFIAAIRLIESYVFRRAVCAIPTNSLNKTFAAFARDIDKNRYLENIKANFFFLPSYRRFPNDEEFKRDLMNRDLYNFPRKSYWLRRLENYRRKERVLMSEYTIEHIMPQNKNLSPQWRQDLGPFWEDIHNTKLHNFGNLTLTGYNSEYSNHPFVEKRDMEGGFKQSPLRLNEGLGDIEIWNDIAIQQRADRLSDLAIEVWPFPYLDDKTIEFYKPSSNVVPSYTIEDHNLLSKGTIGELFQSLRNEILALDPCIKEEFLKHYVSYKAGINIVDVKPQSNRLVLYLNIRFPQLIDTKKKARDMTNIGHLGNGDVEVSITSLDEIQYAISLIRQSFELLQNDK